MILAAKCAPVKKILSDVSDSGVKAVELYLSKNLLSEISQTIQVCKEFPLYYAVHAPNDGSGLNELVELVKGIEAEVVVFHNIYWEDEWKAIVDRFREIPVQLCVENTYSVHEPVKFMRRYGIGRCLDLEHLQMEAAGVYEEVFIPIIKEASHIHMTGYIYGSQLWHTHIHHSPEHSLYMLDLIKKAGYSGFVVSEAKVSLQTYEEFKGLNDFYEMWQVNSNVR